MHVQAAVFCRRITLVTRKRAFSRLRASDSAMEACAESRFAHGVGCIFLALRQSTIAGACKPAAGRVNMISGFRFVVGAILATAMLGVSSLGLYTAVMLRHQAKAGPIESSRNLLFDDRADWNQFYDPDGARRFEELAGKSAASEPAEASAPPAARASENAMRQATAQSAAPDDANAQSTPLWDEEPLLIADEPPLFVMEHTGSTLHKERVKVP
jgi:hypothetical protein